LSLERILNIMLSLGLSQTDAKVYIYLASKGPMKARDIICNLKINKQQLYRSLKKMRNKGIVNSSQGFPTIFSTESFEKALKVLIMEKKKQAQHIEEKKVDLLSLWNLINNEKLES